MRRFFLMMDKLKTHTETERRRDISKHNEVNK